MTLDPRSTARTSGVPGDPRIYVNYYLPLSTMGLWKRLTCWSLSPIWRRHRGARLMAVGGNALGLDDGLSWGLRMLACTLLYLWQFCSPDPKVVWVLHTWGEA